METFKKQIDINMDTLLVAMATATAAALAFMCERAEANQQLVWVG